MRHRKSGRHLGRTPAHRKALYRNLVKSLVERFGTEKEFIYTTKEKAQEVRSLAERCVTLAKKGTLHHRRLAIQLLRHKETVQRLFADVRERYMDRKGGYLRILRTERRRLGDGAPLVFFGWVRDAAASAAPVKKG